MKIKKLFGDRKFYKRVFMICVPMIIQSGITNIVSLVDNVMVGRIGTEQMSGVAISNQLIFVYNLVIFGAVSGAGIFAAQYYGKRDHEGVRFVFRFKYLVCTLFTLLGMLVLWLFKEPLINMFLHDGSAQGDLEATLAYGIDYLIIMLIGLLPFAIKEAYASTLKETGQTVVPMVAGVIAVGVNLVLNYILIFGNFGAPKLGVEGAAIATVISRFVECAFVIAWTHIKKEENQFIKGAYSSFRIPLPLLKSVVIKGTPLLLNESLWAVGMTMMTQSYSTRGLDVIAGLNISSTVSNVFNVVFFSIGSAVAIIVGQLLGADKFEEARDTDTKLIAFGVMSCFVVGGVMAAISRIFPEFYVTTDDAKAYAAFFILVAAILMPVHAFTHASYFTLRSGGKTLITFIFDSGFVWGISVPLAFCLSRFTALPIRELYLICQSVEIVKAVIGFALVKKGVWIHNVVNDNQNVVD